MRTFADDADLHRSMSLLRKKVALLLFHLEGTPEEVDALLSPHLDRPVARLGDVYVGFFIGGDDVRAKARRLAEAARPRVLVGGLATLRIDSMHRGLIERARAALAEARTAGGVVFAPKRRQTKTERNRLDRERRRG